MGEKNESSALTRIEQFNDNKTEQVWELFENEFRNASRSLDGELGWLLVSGGLRVEDVKKEMSKETVAKLVADVAMSSSSTVPFAASWISNKENTGGQLTDAGVLLLRAACHQVLSAYSEVLLTKLLHPESEAHRKMTELVRENARTAVPKFFKNMQEDHGKEASELETAYSTMIMLMQVMPKHKEADVLKDIRRKVKAGETQYPSFDVFDHEKHTTTRYFAENDKIMRKLARVQKSIDGPKGSGVQDDAIARA